MITGWISNFAGELRPGFVKEVIRRRPNLSGQVQLGPVFSENEYGAGLWREAGKCREERAVFLVFLPAAIWKIIRRFRDKQLQARLRNYPFRIREKSALVYV